jgi:hypothetical protein
MEGELMDLVACTSTDVSDVYVCAVISASDNKVFSITAIFVVSSTECTYASVDYITDNNAFTEVLVEFSYTNSDGVVYGSSRGTVNIEETRYVLETNEKVSGTSHFTSSKNRSHFLFLIIEKKKILHKKRNPI